MGKTSAKIALGGVFSALCLIMMFLTGLVPFSQYAMPAVAGAMLIAVVIENGRKAALMVYLSVSLLSVFVVPDRESSVMFIALFGYYPIIKEILEGFRSRVLEYAVKLGIFNAMMVGAYLALAFIFGIPVLTDELGGFGKYSVFVLLTLGNVVFILYDVALSRYVTLYVRWFKPRFLRR